MRIAILLVLLGGIAHAQAVDRRYAEEPTGGLVLPATPLAGEHDARATTFNPGGLALLRGPELALALDMEDSTVATGAGPGFGTYIATSGGGSLVPSYGIGMALEWLRPPRANLEPDPGTPFRFTFAYALGLGANAGFGVAWHHFLAEGALADRDTFDLGLSTRWGSHLAIGATLRDLATSPIAGTPVQRRYELEVVTRPLATDALEVALGGRLGETRLDTAIWGRVGARLARGVYAVGNVESRELHALEDSPMGVRDAGGREVRLTLGLELSFGALGLSSYATGLRNDAGSNHALGGAFVMTVSGVGRPSLVPGLDHIERVELSGDIDQRELTKLVMRMRAIAKDPSAKAMVVTFDGVSGGWGTLKELRDELTNVRHAGKKVFAYMVSGTGRDYFIATAADKIYIDPAGGLRIVGMAGTTLYFKGAFDMLGVVPQFEKIAEYKSAPEQFTETGPTPTAAKMHQDMYDSLWQQWVAAVAQGRGLAEDEVRALVDQGPFSAGDLSHNSKLVDAVAPPDKVSDYVLREVGGTMPIASPPTERPDRWQRPGVAVIYIEGDIVDGESKTIPVLGTRLAGGQTLVGALTAARNDPRVGAIILRIDSPGGSALASELISREVFATRGVKPILCSMSNLAASGGYFVAAGCDVIFAEPTTITGSIGIFSGKFDVGGLIAKLGVTVDTYKHGKHSDIESYYRPYTDEERAVLMDKLRYMYSRFVGAVAEGRKLTKDEVDQRGRGHVYTGQQAQPLKLVDRFGGLGDVLDEAKRRMHLAADTKIQLYELPKVPSNLFGVVGKLLGDDRQERAVIELPIVRALLAGIPGSVLAEPDAVQARLPYDISFPR